MSSLGKHWCAAESHGAGNNPGGEAALGGLGLNRGTSQQFSGKWIDRALFFAWVALANPWEKQGTTVPKHDNHMPTTS